MEEFSKTYSFIIPHKNSPELLNRCLDSIPQRDDIQIIVVDDNSEDNKKPKVLRDDVEIVYVDAKETKGAGHARNVGFAHAKGKWLLFPDCDDYYKNDFLEILDKYKDSDIEVLYFNYEFKDGHSGLILEENLLQKTISGFDASKEKEVIVRYRNNTPWTKMVHHDFVKRIGAYFEEVTNGNDVLFSLFIGYKVNKLDVDKTKLYYYVKTPNSIGTKKQSIEGQMCRLTHVVKHNYFNSKLGHNEWNISPCKFVLSRVKSMRLLDALSFFYAVFSSIPELISQRKEWVYLIIKK